MLDQILEMFDRENKKRPIGKRSLLGHVSDALSDRDHRHYEDRSDRRYTGNRRDEDDDRYSSQDHSDQHRRDDGDYRPQYADDRQYDDRPRYPDDRYERRQDDDDAWPRDADNRYRGGEYRAPSKKKRLADLLDFD